MMTFVPVRVPRRRLGAGWKPERASSPSILEGARGLVPAYWTLDWLARMLPTERVPVRIGSQNSVSMPLGRAIARIRSGPRAYLRSRGSTPYYVADWRIREVPRLYRQLRKPFFTARDGLATLPSSVRPELLWAYIGGPGTGSPLHQDVLATHAWMFLIEGCKRWLLYPPEAFEPQEARSHDAFSPEGAAADRRRGRRPWVGDLRAGDLMFVPSMWWHQVRNLSPTFAITGNFSDASNAVRVIEECVRTRREWMVSHLVGTYELDSHEFARR